MPNLHTMTNAMKRSSNQKIIAAAAAMVTILVISGQQHLATAANLHQTQENKPNSNGQVLVSTGAGTVIGSEHNISADSSVYKFLSVPYAQAPIGSLRFKKSVELDNTSPAENNILNSIKMGPTCPQFRHLSRFVNPLLNIDQEHQINEDCLHLHIYVPKQQQAAAAANKQDQGISHSSSQLPVIVWLPGEGFDFADARQFDGSHLASEANAIVIVVQYRVGVLGFLNSPAWNISGNMGLHDQLMALRWISKSIASFGGDSDNVTLMGRFTGAMSISSLITAPKQELIRKPNGQLLFRRVALLSGVTVDRWIIDEHQQERAKALSEAAQEQGLCSTGSSEFECMQTMPLTQLIKMADYAWRPSIDNELIGSQMPAEAIKKGLYPGDLEAILLGETAAEGSLCLMRHMLTQETRFGDLLDSGKVTSDDLYDMIRDDSRFYFKHEISKSNPIQRALESMLDYSELSNSADSGAENKIESGEEQITNEPSGENLREKYVNACSSYLIKFHLEELKRNLLAKNRLEETRLDLTRKPISVYHYELTYKPSYSVTPAYIKTASHGDDVPLIFGLGFAQLEKVSEEDLVVSRKMMKLVASFARGDSPQLSALVNNLNNKSTSPTMHQQRSASKQLSKRRANIHSTWSNEAQKMTIELDYEMTKQATMTKSSKQSDQSEISDELMQRSEQQQQQQSLPVAQDKPASDDSKFVMIEREAKVERRESFSLPLLATHKAAGWPSQKQRQMIINNNDWTTGLDLTRQPSSINLGQMSPVEGGSITAARQQQQLHQQADYEDANNQQQSVLLLMTIGALIMSLIILTLGFALLRMQNNLQKVNKILENYRRLLRSDDHSHSHSHHHNHQQLTDDTSQGPKSETSMDAVLALDSSTTQANKTTKTNVCNMLNKLSNHHHRNRDELNDEMTNKLDDLQGSSIGSQRRESNGSDHMALTMQHHDFNHLNHHHH